MSGAAHDRPRALVPGESLGPFLAAAVTVGALGALIGLLSSGARPVLLVLVAISPTPFGAWLVWREHGRFGVTRLFRRVLRWRFSPAYYAIALLLAPAVTLSAQSIAVLSGHEGPDDWILSPTAALSPELLVLIPGVVLTEIGWRGFALPAAMLRLGSVVGALVIGVAEGVWNLGLVGLGADAPPLGALAVIGSALAWSPIWAFLTQRTNGSLLATILFHLSLLYWADVVPGDAVGAAIALALYGVAAVWASSRLPSPRARQPRPPTLRVPGLQGARARGLGRRRTRT